MTTLRALCLITRADPAALGQPTSETRRLMGVNNAFQTVTVPVVLENIKPGATFIETNAATVASLIAQGAAVAV